MKGNLQLPAVALLVVAMTIFVTWPQALVMNSMIAAHDDPMFSMWRLAWIAHALRDAPLHLLDANILYPAGRTLTFADTTILESSIALPLLWAKVPLTVTYNLLLLGGMAASGLAMFVLARYVVGAAGPALVSAAIFTMVPYRIEHFMHLELQWAMWIPLTFWALNRAIDERSRRAGLLAGLFLFLQIVSCVYYGVFLAIASAALVLLLGLTSPRRFMGALPVLALAGVVAVALTAPYLWVYLETARTAGPRGFEEVAAYSATPASYLASPPQNWLWGWTSPRWGHAELSLYPGIIAVGLAAVAAVSRPRRTVVVYAAVAALAVELSFGVHGRLYPWLEHAGLQGLRSPSRFAIVATCAIAVLAGLGVRTLQERFFAGTGRAAIPVAVSLVLIGVDYANTGMYLTRATRPADATVYRVMRSAGPGVVIELPLPVPEGLPGRDANYQYWSTSHWHPLVNGYTALYTSEYIETLDRMRTFPDDQSIRRLETLGVRYLVVHRTFYPLEQYTSLLVRIGNRRELHPYGIYTDPIGEADLFVLEQN
jgi:hypothetical protein